MRRAGIAMIGWLAINWLTGTSGYAAAYPQDPQKQRTADAPAKSEPLPPEGKPSPEMETNAADQDASQTLPRNAKGLGKRFLLDQKQIWTSPTQLRWADANWLVPLSGITAGMFVTDADMSRHLSHNATTISHFNTISNASLAGMLGGAGAMWLFSYPKHNEHWRETGFLAGEAVVNSLVVVEAMKYPLGRQRPYQGNADGNFFKGGTSFPSEHSTAAWAAASVVAHEYPGPLTKIVVYSLATLVDFSRYRARQHFPSDILIGSVIGNLVAEGVYTQHHNVELGGSTWEPIRNFLWPAHATSSANSGSPYVPLDSWIYPALDRLSAMGLTDSGFAGMRPWTRSECARLLNEAAPYVGVGKGGPEAEKTFRMLETEFRDEIEGKTGEGDFHGRLESVYARVTAISGVPLTDGNHFGQSLINDYGRPYQEGFNSVDGFSAWTTAGPWVGYVRAEYQHSPSASAQPDSARQFIASVDNIPGVPPATLFSAVNRARLLDAYVGLRFENWQVSFGKQSLWWSPVQGGPMMFSDNAEPLNMFRINRVSPFKLPSIFGWLGPIRVEWFLGQFAGHQFVFQSDTGIVGQFGRSLDRQPFLQGQKISLKPTPNFEFSVSTTTVFAGGPGVLNWHTFLRSYSLGNSRFQGGADDPGDRRSGVDFSYRVPGLRDWLTFYGDAFDEDEFSPLGYPRKSAIRGGIYLPRIPGLPKLDLRLEGGSTVPPDFPGCNGCFYVNNRYPDGSYTNLGNLVGSWLGRGGQGEQAWSTYWLTSRNKIQFTYRHQKVSTPYLPQGGTLNDGGVSADFWLGPAVMLSGAVQYEKWNYPVLNPLPRSNVATSIQFTFWPRSWK